jgi:hypothetical protein
MPIAFQCSCGTNLKADERNAGLTVRCPGCANLLTVPTLSTRSESGCSPGKRPENAPETAVLAERVEEEELRAEAVEEDDFDVLEDDHDLPTAERVKKPKKPRAQASPQRRTLQDDLYSDSSESFLGVDMGGSAKSILYAVFVALCTCCVISSFLGVVMRLFNAVDKLKN